MPPNCATSGFLHTQPHGRRWAKRLRSTQRARKAWKAEEATFNRLVGSVNAKIDLLDTLLAQAGHHVGISGSDVRRQASLYARRVILSQPEPVVGKVFPIELPTPVREKLRQFLIGVAAVPAFEKLTTDALVKRQEEIGGELRQLDETLSAVRARRDDAAHFGTYEGGPR
jgi:hypothetical protein